MARQKVAVLVFGDVGRSPRMQNHALLLADYYDVSLVGDNESKVYPEILENQNIKLLDLSSKTIALAKKTNIFIFYLLVRIIVQTFLLLWTFLIKLRGIKFVVVQNPPSIPVLAVLWFASLLKRFEVVVDFHNYGYTILALKVKLRPIIQLAEKYQKFFSKRCHKHLCVSNKMLLDLKNQWGIDAIELRDAPMQRTIIKMDDNQKNQLLEKVTGRGRSGNQLIIVSSTSWTKDQDFSILLKVVEQYEAEWREKLPNLRVYITGKGPEKQHYEKYIKSKEDSWKHIEVKTLWLTHEDYPRFLASCDLGVCLHYSSSGLDLPMKVIDMFSAGLPVLAIKYQTIGQLVLQPYNGYLFQNNEDLYKRLHELAVHPEQISKMSNFIESTRSNSFQREWKSVFTKLKLIPN